MSKIVFVLFIFITFITNCVNAQNLDEAYCHQLKSEYLADFQTFTNSIKSFEKGIESCDFDQSVVKFKEIRSNYKKLQMWIEYYDSIEVKYYINGAPLPKAEEEANYPNLIAPYGLQTIEEKIYEKADKSEIRKLLNKLSEDCNYVFERQQKLPFYIIHLFEASRNELIRIMTLGVTGFDTPASGNALEENLIALQTILNNYAVIQDEILEIKKWGKMVQLFKDAQRFIENSELESFDHIIFFKAFIQPLYRLIYDIHLELCYSVSDDFTSVTKPVNYHDTLFYSEKFFNADYFSDSHKRDISEQRAKLGGRLFYDNILSVNINGSCASCHLPEKAFTDGLRKSAALQSKPTLKRNAPTTVNSLFAERFFWDMGVKSLAKQIERVIIHQNEFKINFKIIAERLKKEDHYINSFDKAYPGIGINHWTITNALTNFIIKQSSFNSEFDQFMRNEGKLSLEAQNGYNLFMGKAACATCHFPPLFGGLVPPLYRESESEVIGVPKYNDLKNPVIDEDRGRYDNTIDNDHFENFIFSFKTPSIRNAEVTGPYMHNGVFDSLEEVMDFYNAGGGVGSGIELQNQTLPSDSLNLSDKEINDIIAFMKSLTDYKGFENDY